MKFQPEDIIIIKCAWSTTFARFPPKWTCWINQCTGYQRTW